MNVKGEKLMAAPHFFFRSGLHDVCVRERIPQVLVLALALAVMSGCQMQQSSRHNNVPGGRAQPDVDVRTATAPRPRPLFAHLGGSADHDKLARKRVCDTARYCLDKARALSGQRGGHMCAQLAVLLVVGGGVLSADSVARAPTPTRGLSLRW